MPFNIELAKLYEEEVSIKIQVVKDTLNVYFKLCLQDPEEALFSNTHFCAQSSWQILESSVIGTLPGFDRDRITGPDAVHVKKQHTHRGERAEAHFHHAFEQTITPEIFSRYLTELFACQQSATDPRYNFFVNKFEVEDIAEKYADYYKNRTDSTEELYKEQTTLTEKEQLDYEAALQKEAALAKRAKGAPPLKVYVPTSSLSSSHSFFSATGAPIAACLLSGKEALKDYTVV